MTLHIEMMDGSVAIKRGDELLFISVLGTSSELTELESLAYWLVTTHNTVHDDTCCDDCGHTLRKGKCPLCKHKPENWGKKKCRKRAQLVDETVIEQREEGLSPNPRVPNIPKIWRIKVARNIFGLGLRESKNWVERAYYDNGQGDIK